MFGQYSLPLVQSMTIDEIVLALTLVATAIFVVFVIALYAAGHDEER
jgi:hypothetical protein